MVVKSAGRGSRVEFLVATHFAALYASHVSSTPQGLRRQYRGRRGLVERPQQKQTHNEVFREILEIEKERRSQSTHDTLPASKTQPMAHREAYTSPRSYFSHPFQFPNQLQPFLVDFDSVPQPAEQQLAKMGILAPPSQTRATLPRRRVSVINASREEKKTYLTSSKTVGPKTNSLIHQQGEDQLHIQRISFPTHRYAALIASQRNA